MVNQHQPSIDGRQFQYVHNINQVISLNQGSDKYAL